MTATDETYAELQAAYSHFNGELFGSELPGCLITLQRRKGTFGYLSHNRFVNREGKMADEIAMNPSYFASRSIEDVLSTLVHEMTHLWQAAFGKPGRGRYHNKEWAAKMKSVGLHPSDTGEPGGKEVGDLMSHFTVDDGPFEHSARALLTEDFQLSWLDRFPEALPSQTPGSTVGADLLRIGVVEPEPAAPKSKSNRVKFQCAQCGASAWGKPSLNLVCGDCDLALVAA